ncbi:AAA family ATPase [Maridesulfovibrio frigidus]|uniref:AAA family ATPase n=1 Tax=Maridesulfovibrio frigidus TaxID=340956 RepID=UPI0004E1D37F|nr:ATP-binding protein [Maridesulfovibrio frigidus]
MITSIRLIDWKSFADATLYLDPLTVLIGTNASGKSNILDALEFIRRIASGVSVDAALVGSEELPPLRGGRAGAIRHGAKQFSIKLQISIKKHDYEYSISVATEESKVKITAESLYDVNGKKYIMNIEKKKDLNTYVALGKSLLFGQDITLGKPIYVLESVSDFPKHAKNITQITDELCNLFPFKPMPERMRNPTTLSDNLSYNGFNIAGFLANHEDKKKIESKLLKFVTELPEGDITEVWSETIGRTEAKAELYCKESWGNTNEDTIVDANSMSDGTLRFIAILIAVLTMEPGGLIAIEELDNGLHPSRAELLLRSLRELGAKRGVDVLAVTHNPALLNTLGPKGIPFVSVVHRNQQGNSVITLLEDVERLPKLLAGGPLGELVTQGKIQEALQDEDK